MNPEYVDPSDYEEHELGRIKLRSDREVWALWRARRNGGQAALQFCTNSARGPVLRVSIPSPMVNWVREVLAAFEKRERERADSAAGAVVRHAPSGNKRTAP